MCTKKIERIKNKKSVIGWKVVLYHGYNGNNICTSYYIDSFVWKRGENYSTKSDIDEDNLIDLFHCFANREGARKHKRNSDHKNAKIIKVVLKGKIYKGITSGMQYHHSNGFPATLGTIAYWDGKFHS